MVLRLIDDVYKRYKSVTNMSFSEVKAWSKTKKSKAFGRSSINKTLRLLGTPKKRWGVRELRWATSLMREIRRIKTLLRCEIGALEYLKNEFHRKRRLPFFQMKRRFTISTK